MWNTTEHPAAKLKSYIRERGWWNEDEETAYVQQVRKQVLKQISESEKMAKPRWQELFNDVYDVQPAHLK